MTKYFLFFSVIISLSACGQTKNKVDKDKDSIDLVCDQVMKSFLNSKVSEAMRLLKENSIMSTASIDTLSVKVEDHFLNVFPGYGKIVKYEFIKEAKVKDIIAKRYYLLEFEKYYLKVDFTLYKTTKGWTITSFFYNDDLLELLE